MKELKPAVQHRADLFDIASRRKRSNAGVASAADFDLAYCGNASLDFVRRHGIAYCADFEKRRLLFTLFDNPVLMLQQPFLYASQYASATQVACIPFDLLDTHFPKVAPQLNFMFSAGRCGSTLLAALLRVCGLPTASEPDLLTQLARDRVFHTDRNLAECLQNACIGSLADHCGNALAVKLRSQCNSIALQVARAFPSAKFVFILREPIPWARSRYRAFRGNPKQLASMYRAAVNSYDRLCNANYAPILLWYEDIADKPLRMLEYLAGKGVPLRQIEAEALVEVLAHDSQASTHLAPRKLNGPEMTAEEIREFDEEWRRIRPHEILQQRNLQRIC